MRPAINKLNELIEEPSVELGTLIDIDYSKITFATTDEKITRAGGAPQRGFLLAAAPSLDGEETPEVLLISIRDRVRLSQDASFQPVKEERAIAGGTNERDPRTELKMATLGFSCEIVGTFYKRNGVIQFGGDLDRIRGNSNYKIYKPRGRTLSYIASFSNKTLVPEAVLDLGVVRFSETQLDPDPGARAYINIEDFIGKKSGVLGITRSGKSNTIKVICQKTFEYAKATNRPVGQLIFDPQGEYSNQNVQDAADGKKAEALADIGTADEVRIYKMLTPGERVNEKVDHLQFSLYDEDNIGILWKIMLQNLKNSISGTANYIANLEHIHPQKPKNFSKSPQWEQDKWNAHRLGIYALAGMSMGEPTALKHPFDFPLATQEDLDIVLEHSDDLHASTKTTYPYAVVVENTDDAKTLLEALVYNGPEENKDHAYNVGTRGKFSPDTFKLLSKGPLKPFRDQIFARDKGANGVIAAFRKTQPFHNDRAAGDVREKIWADMKKGRLVMVDLSKGNQQTVKVLSEMIVEHLVDHAGRRFTAGEEMIEFQLVVEEAHNLFGAGSDKNYLDPWVRLSKEGSKYNIGLVFATQEVTSVDTRILSNTSNWIISHLNSKDETNNLSKYYLFDEWAEHIRKVEAKGFVRMKNESSPYIVPVQIDIFRVNSNHDDVPEVISSPEETLDFLDETLEF